MYKTGDYVHYEGTGLCRVEEITRLQMPGADTEKLYYRLTPIDVFGGALFCPVDNPKVKIRKALTEEEARCLIEEMPAIEALQISEERSREQSYRKAVMSTDCKSWVSVIKTLNYRRKDRLSHGRKVTATDEKYMRSAQNRLYTELAVALGIKKEELEAFIGTRLG